MSSAGAEFFFKDQLHDRNRDQLGRFGGGFTGSSHSPMIQPAAASITPESFQSYQNGPTDSQLIDRKVLQESPFDFSDYDESINFGIGKIPQQQESQRQQMITGFDGPECAVKSEYSPVFPVSASSSVSQSSSSINKNDFVDFLNDGCDDLVQDEFGTSVGPGGLHDTNGKIVKKRKEKTSHNVIEKKYRTNINDKIFQLREIVPTLRVAYKKYSGMPLVAQDAESLDGLEPARKLNKASILMKTIEYIQHLEAKCAEYRSENQRLKTNIHTPESLRQQTITSAAAIAAASAAPTIPGGQRATDHSNSIPTHMAGHFESLYDSPACSAGPSSTSNTQNSVPVGNTSSYASDFASKFLMGGMALSMGASCLGDNGGDLGSARALFAMPIFRFSPQSGFVMSNSHGVIDLQASVFALLKISLVLMTVVYLLNSLLFSKSTKDEKSAGLDSASIFSTKDTVQFDTTDHLKQTLRKTLIINRLKYKLNSMERIESKIAKCFAIKIYFRNSGLPWSFLAGKYVDKVWQEMKNQVIKANIKSKGLLRMGLEWDMITYITTVGREMTLENPNLIKILSSDEKEHDLKEFISLLYTSILKEKTEDMLCSILKILVKSPFEEWSGIIKTFKIEQVDRNEILQSIPEKCCVFQCLLEPSKQSCDELSKWIKVSKDETSDDLLDEKLVLYGSITRHLIELGQFDQCTELIKKLPLKELDSSRDSISIVGFTSMYLMLNAIFENLNNFTEHSLVLETVCGELRIWLGSSPGDVIKFGTRAKLITYCLDQALMCDSLTQNDSDVEVSDDLKTDCDDTNISDELTDCDE